MNEFLEVFNLPPAWVAVIVGIAVIVPLICFAIRPRKEEEDPGDPDWLGLFAEPEDKPATVIRTPVTPVPPKPNPIEVRCLERLAEAMLRDDIATVYRQKARMVGAGWQVPNTAEECAARLAELRGEA